MTGSAVVDIKTAAEFDSLATGSLVVHFWADWAEQCKQVDQIISALQQVHQQGMFNLNSFFSAIMISNW
jgi:thioredoxin-like negative regulator of GroEL